MMNPSAGGPALVIAAAGFLILGIAYLVLRRTVNFYRDNHVDRDDPPYLQARTYLAQIAVGLWVLEALCLSVAAVSIFYFTPAVTLTVVLAAAAGLAIYRHWPDLTGFTAHARS